MNSLKLAEKNQLTTVAFPNISTGVYHFPKHQAANIAIQAVLEYMKNAQSLDEINFVCFDLENFKIYRRQLAEVDQNQFHVLGI